MIALNAYNKFPDYTRATYPAAHGGAQAPDFNPGLPIKPWEDQAAVDGDNSYQTWDGSIAEPKLTTLVLPGAVAKTVNLPGLRTFPKYTSGPTPATRILHFNGADIGAAQAVPANQLSTQAESDALAALVGATAVDASLSNAFWKYEWNGEARRPFTLQYKSLAAGAAGPFAGDVIADQNSKGVGAPGHWSASQIAAGQLQWVPETPDDGSGSHPTMPDPVAPPPGWKLVSVAQGIGFVGPYWVQDTGSTGTGDGTGGSFTADDRSKLTAIYKATGGA